MVNHKIEISVQHKHAKVICSNAMWNINTIHDARAQIRHLIGKYTKEGAIFKIKHNGNTVYDSNNPFPTIPKAKEEIN